MLWENRRTVMRGQTDEAKWTGRLFSGAKACIFPCSYQGLRWHVALSLISVLALTQMPPAYSTEVSGPGTSDVNNCSALNSDFETGLKQLAETVTERTEIPSEFLQRYFARCTIERAEEFLAKNRFDTGESAPAFGDRKAGITRTVLAEKIMKQSGLVSLNCRIILDDKASSGLDVHGFFYFDGP
jgi:hypothetical protein